MLGAHHILPRAGLELVFRHLLAGGCEDSQFGRRATSRHLTLPAEHCPWKCRSAETTILPMLSSSSSSSSSAMSWLISTRREAL